MGRPSTARERLLDAACRLIGDRSYASVGVAEICLVADVRKGSFYHFFESKQALTLQAVDRHWQRQRDGWTATTGTTEPALDRLRRLLADTTADQRRAHQRDGVVSGCLLANLALELSGQEPAVQERLRKIFDDQIDLIQALLGEAAAEGSIPGHHQQGGAGNDTDHRRTARAVLAQLEGLLLFAKVADDPTILVDVWPHTLRLLASAPTPADRDRPGPTRGAVPADP